MFNDISKWYLQKKDLTLMWMVKNIRYSLWCLGEIYEAHLVNESTRCNPFMVLGVLLRNLWCLVDVYLEYCLLYILSLFKFHFKSPEWLFKRPLVSDRDIYILSFIIPLHFPPHFILLFCFSHCPFMELHSISPYLEE